MRGPAIRAAALIGCWMLVGCAGKASPAHDTAVEAGASVAGASTEPSGQSTAGGEAGQASGAGVNTDALAPLRRGCGQAGDSVPTLSKEEVENQLLGVWVYCSGPVMLNVPHDGIEFEAGQYYFLRLDAEGTLQRQKGFDGGGAWQVENFGAGNPPGYEFQLDIDGSIGRFTTFAFFQSAPRGVRFDMFPQDFIEYIGFPPEGGP